MHIVAVYGWHQEESVVAKTIADTMGSLVFETRQKISDGGPAVVASFADAQQAKLLAARLIQGGVPALVVDVDTVRSKTSPLYIHRFILGPQLLRLELSDGKVCSLDYRNIDLLLVATCTAGQSQIMVTETQRKFSLGKTVLAGGIPMTKKVKSETVVVTEERDETLWLYTRKGARAIFDRAAMNYNSLGDAMQLTRDLNFSHFKNELQRLAPQATFDDRLLKRAALIRLLGPALNPEVDHDLAFEILARSLKEKSD